jgi:DNA-binding MltR family transcriptional regulator
MLKERLLNAEKRLKAATALEENYANEGEESEFEDSMTYEVLELIQRVKDLRSKRKELLERARADLQEFEHDARDEDEALRESVKKTLGELEHRLLSSNQAAN